MNTNQITRREFCRTSLGAAVTAVPGVAALTAWASEPKPVVSIVRIQNQAIEAAVEEAIDLLGGIGEVTRGKNRILLKPNLVIENPNYATKPPVIGALARLLQSAGKEVLIGEGSAGANGFNLFSNTAYSTRCPDILEPMQRFVFDQLGYTALAKALGVPLLNLHTGEMVTVPVPAGLFWNEIVLPRALAEVDLLVSVPMMKTHTLATVTLGLKNLIGCYAGSVYGALRWWVHDVCVRKFSPGVAFEILDMARVNQLGLTVIDASTALQGDGPTSGGSLVAMNLIIAGTDPLATDMVGTAVMGFTNLEAIPTFAWAHKLGMTPATLADIEVRGEPIAQVKRNFSRPSVSGYSPGSPDGSPEMWPAPQPKIELTADRRVVVTWDEAILRPRLQFTAENKAFLTWTNTATGSPRSILERNVRLQKTGWVRATPQTPGRFEYDTSQADTNFFRLRKPY